MIWFETFARTEVGCERERNEDAFLVLDVVTGNSALLPELRRQPLAPPGTLVAVCDGMGGAAAGDVASRLALDAMAAAALSNRQLHDVEAWEQVLVEGVARANAAIVQHTREHPQKRGMGTTMTAAAIFGQEVVILQVGDSRAYLQRGPTLTQLTMDQSVVGQMIAAGQLRPEDARTAQQRNVLLEAIGVAERFGPDLVRVIVQPGDVLLLCSDGLNGPLPDSTILDIMQRYEDPVPCSRALTEAACAAGGPDNVTVVLVRFLSAANADVSQPVRSYRRPVLIGA